MIYYNKYMHFLKDKFRMRFTYISFFYNSDGHNNNNNNVLFVGGK